MELQVRAVLGQSPQEVWLVKETAKAMMKWAKTGVCCLVNIGRLFRESGVIRTGTGKSRIRNEKKQLDLMRK